MYVIHKMSLLSIVTDSLLRQILVCLFANLTEIESKSFKSIFIHSRQNLEAFLHMLNVFSYE